ncbi:class I SAM-dependent methyltransferase [Acidobacteriota bacterium]
MAGPLSRPGQVEIMKKDPYKNIAKLYDRLIEPLNRGLRGLGKKMYPPLENMKVLDIGCGTGTHLSLYQKAGCVVSGIDLSPAMLQRARKKLGSATSLIQGDASQMPYPDKSFDLIILTTVLHEMPPNVRTAVIEDSKRVLKDSGRILVIDYHTEPLRSLKGQFNKSMIFMIEKAAGKDHYKNFRQFIDSQGLPGISAAQELFIDARKIVSGGNIALFLLRLKN